MPREPGGRVGVSIGMQRYVNWSLPFMGIKSWQINVHSPAEARPHFVGKTPLKLRSNAVARGPRATESTGLWRKRVGVEIAKKSHKSRGMMALHSAVAVIWSQLESKTVQPSRADSVRVDMAPKISVWCRSQRTIFKVTGFECTVALLYSSKRLTSNLYRPGSLMS